MKLKIFKFQPIKENEKRLTGRYQSVCPIITQNKDVTRKPSRHGIDKFDVFAVFIIIAMFFLAEYDSNICST